MRFLYSLLIVGLAIEQASAADPVMPPTKAAEFFEKSIRPVLAENCFSCHSDRKQKGGLRLDSRQGTGGPSAPWGGAE